MLRKYTPADFKFLQQWVTDENILFLFSGPDWVFPLTEESINEQIEKFPFRQFYMGCDDGGEPFAFGQLITNEANAPRLGRLLVGDPGKRGKGLGQQFIKELIDEAVKIYGFEEMHLFVYENNILAIKCYEKLGFKFNEDTKFSLIRNGMEIKIFKMTLKIKN